MTTTENAVVAARSTMKPGPRRIGRTRRTSGTAAALGTIATAIAACLGFALPLATQAQAFPERPIKLVVPFPPGGSTDLVGRIVGKKAGELLGQPVIIENRGGAGGSIGSELVAQAQPDGYTLLMATTSHTANPSFYPKLPYDTRRDFQSIAMIADMPGLLVAKPGLPPNTLDEFLAFARDRQLQYGSAGTGTFPHLSMELIRSAANLKMTHIPYKGAAPALTDLVGGVYDVKVDAYITAAEYVKTNKLKLYAVTSKERMPQLPETPAVAERIPGFESTYWIGIVGPANLPTGVRSKLETAFIAAVKDNEVVGNLAATGTRAVGAAATELDARIDRELALWPGVVKASGLTQ